MDRRKFLGTARHLAYLPFLVNGIPIEALCNNPLFRLASASANDRVLVLVHLIGGNDGLNTIIPLDQYANLIINRPEVILPEKKIIEFSDRPDLGFHPSLKELSALYEAGNMSIIQNVGLVKPSFSHFRATDIWLTGSETDAIENSGWLGRYLDTVYTNYPHGYPNQTFPHPPAIQIGSMLSSIFRSEHFMMGYTLDPYSSKAQARLETIETPYQKEISFIEEMMRQTNTYSQELDKILSKSSNLSQKYPTFGQNNLADQLKLVSRLIAGGLKSKVFIVNHQGFDTHANQVDISDHTLGHHSIILKQMSVAIDAFMEDCQLLGISDKVMGMTFSEFGRRIKGNSSNGTDHGTAAPIFLFGNQLDRKVIGKNATIPDKAAVEVNLDVEIDFKTVYANILRDWFEVGDDVINGVLTEDGTKLPLVITGTKADNIEKRNKSFVHYGQDCIFIHLASGFKKNLNILLCDNAGKIFRQWAQESKDNILQIDTYGIIKGLYLYKITDGINETTGKLIV